MSDRGLPDLIEHLMLAAQQACDYVDGMSEDEFVLDRRTQQAVIFNLMIMGEAATRLLKEHTAFVAEHGSVPWNSMKGMRNRLAHGYFDIDLAVVWRTVQSDLPALLQELRPILAEVRAREGSPKNSPY